MLKIVCIGSGRLANQLMPALETAGGEVVQVYNRSLATGSSLAQKLQTTNVTSDIQSITGNADIYFITVSDDAIPSLASQLTHLENEHAIFVHCSGVLPLDALPFKRCGVFYPLQTFSYQHEVDWSTTPILITAGAPEINQELFALARRISRSVFNIRDSDKTFLHLSAVWANNFTNHMLTIAEKLCLEHHINFDILKPLIRETFEKALEVGPADSQTGPALRGDEKTIDKHLQLLDQDESLRKLYMLISDHIRKSVRP